MFEFCEYIDQQNEDSDGADQGEGLDPRWDVFDFLDLCDADFVRDRVALYEADGISQKLVSEFDVCFADQ